MNIGELLKELGKARAAGKRVDDLEIVRAEMKRLCLARPSGEVTADDAAEFVDRIGMERLGPAAGSIFNSKDFEFTGDWIHSVRPQVHAHCMRVWRLRKK